MKRLVLHIGFNKTGSTSIQTDLVLNADALQAQGVLYPNDASAPYMQRVQHLPLATAMSERRITWMGPKKRATLDQAYPSLHAALKQQQFETLLLSSESFGGLDMTPQNISWIKDQFADYHTTILAYIRRQDQYFLSRYQQDIKNGGTNRFEFCAHTKRRQLDFAHRLAPWRKIFGADRVIVRPFAPALWHEGVLLYDFLSALGLEYRGLQLSPPVNEGLDYRVVELLRRANELELPQQCWLRLCRGLKDIMPADFSPRKIQLSSTDSETLRQYYRNSNIRALEGSGIDVDLFFPAPDPGCAACLPPAELPEQLLFELVTALAQPNILGSSDPENRQ